MDHLSSNDTVVTFFHKAVFGELHLEFAAPKSLNFLKNLWYSKYKKSTAKVVKSHYTLYSFIRDSYKRLWNTSYTKTKH